MSGAATETTIHYLLPCQLYSVQKVELPNGAYKLDSTLKNSSEDQSLTVLLYGSQKFALNVNKEIIRLTVKLFKILRMFCSTPFLINKICIYFFLFLFFILSIHLLFLYVSLYRAYCKWLHLTWVLCLVPSTVLCIIFHIYCFIVGFIVSACIYINTCSLALLTFC